MNYVADLRPFKMKGKIRVKVIRLWKPYSATVGEKMFGPSDLLTQKKESSQQYNTQIT